MAVTDVTTLSMAEAGAALRGRELSPLELTEAYLRRIERLNPANSAFITITAERALADAHRATEELRTGPPRASIGVHCMASR
jgi:Asp-tRNA(Asn)/Glu-tRNA(Gln) amidotransferase A subunit family amidase